MLHKRSLAKIVGLTLVVLVLWLTLPTKSGPPSNEQAESSAVAQLRVINTAEVTCFSASGGKFGTIQELIGAGLLDQSFADEIYGYSFEVRLSGATDYLATASPAGDLGRYVYSSAPDAVIRYRAGPKRNMEACSALVARPNTGSASRIAPTVGLHW